jgi:hypothetical protein
MRKTLIAAIFALALIASPAFATTHKKAVKAPKKDHNVHLITRSAHAVKKTGKAVGHTTKKVAKKAVKQII